jgi:hypothetical protein
MFISGTISFAKKKRKKERNLSDIEGYNGCNDKKTLRKS